jgi:hypothetical protein
MGPGPNIVAGGQVITRVGRAETPAARVDRGIPTLRLHRRPSTPVRSILYAFIAHYTGKGDPNDAANFEPVKSPVRFPISFHTEATKLIGPNNRSSITSRTANWRKTKSSVADGGAIS